MRSEGTAGRLERALAICLEIPAALLVAAEIVLLLAAVVARYALGRPLTWSDELASSLFLWLAMLGSAVALCRGEHMRMSALISRLPAKRAVFADNLVQAIVAALLAVLAYAALGYMRIQWSITTPALDIPDGLRVAAIPVCAIAMLAIALLRLISRRAIGSIIAALAGAGVLVAAAGSGQAWLGLLGNYNLVLFFVLLLGLCVATGMPIAFAFATATIAFVATATHAPLTIVVSRMDEGMSALILLAVPLFVFLGLLMEATGMAEALVALLAALIGHLRGGLSFVLVGAMFLVSGISGSKAADMAAVAPALFPEMKRRGEAPEELVALLAASGAMSETIPPSLVLITVGSVTGVSIAALFTGGVVPAVVCALALAVAVALRSRRSAHPVSERQGKARVIRSLLIALPALALPFLIRFAVVHGIATATEVSTLGIAYTALAGWLLYRPPTLKRCYRMLVDTASLSGAILSIIGMATAMGWALTQSGFSAQLASAVAAVPGGRVSFLALSILVFTLLGSVLEGIPAIVLFGPLLFPSARALGIHEVQYAIVAILSMGLGLFAPPLGVGFYVASAIGQANPDAAMRRVWPYLAAVALGVIACAAIPWLSTGFL